MKLYRKIDSLWNTEEKRRRILLAGVSLYWIWQFVWQILFFFRLFSVHDYDTLFIFYGNMDAYQSSLLVRWALIFISSVELNAAEVLFSLTSWDWIFMILSILCLLTVSKKTAFIFFNLFLISAAGLLVLLALAAAGRSLMEVIGMLRAVSLWGLITTGVLLFSVLVRFVHAALKKA